MTPPPTVVLYVEDEETDAFLMQRAFDKEGLKDSLRVVTNGLAAVDYLSGSGNYAQRETHPLPNVVLLDLNMPEMDGFDVLKWIRAHPLHCGLHVVVFSSSILAKDRTRAMELGANDFIQKPIAVSKFQEVARRLHEQYGRRLGHENRASDPRA